MNNNESSGIALISEVISLPGAEYLLRLGEACYAFQSLVTLVIECSDKEHHNVSDISWFDAIEKTAGKLKTMLEKKGLDKIFGQEFLDKFYDVVKRRNKIIHSLTCTYRKIKTQSNQCFTYYDKGDYIYIDFDFLIKFIVDCNNFERQLDELRSKGLKPSC